MEFRFGSLTFANSTVASRLKDFQLRVRTVRYPWVDTDSAFTSSSPVLNAVYDLCRYTTKATSLDTYTDSNTRERLPYELDGARETLCPLS